MSTKDRKYSYIVRVRLVRERAEKFGVQLTCARAVFDALRDELSGLDREHFVVFHLDIKNRLLSRETVSIGHLSSALVHPREVFKGAILANAASVVLAHNHPSCDPEPSREDIELTSRLRRAGELLGIPVLDHIVIAADKYASLAEMGV